MAWSEAGTITPDQQSIWAAQVKELALFFQVKENPVVLCPPDVTLKVVIPSNLEKQRFHVSLYHETKSLLKKLDQLPRNKG